MARLHDDEIESDADLVRALLTAQFSHWAGLSIRPVASTGTSNAIYRLGEDLAVRLPRRPGGDRQFRREAEWLPKLAPHLPTPIPSPQGLGEPGERFPHAWAVCSWLEGVNPGEAEARSAAFAADLAGVVAALQAISPAGGLPPGGPNSRRGAPLASRDSAVREALAALAGELKLAAAVRVWEAALAAPVHEGEPVWLHGDLLAGNLLALDGRLSALIDFGCLGVGDPACDLMAAWTVLGPEARTVFRKALSFDEGAWARARGWALSVALIQIPYYRLTNPGLTAEAWRTVREVLADPEG